MNMPHPVLKPPVGPMTACTAYLRSELDLRNNSLWVGVMPPPATPRHQPSSGRAPMSYALIGRPGNAQESKFANKYLLRARVFDDDSERLEDNADLVYALMMAVGHRKISTPRGDVWITAAEHQMGPSDYDDPTIPAFGLQMAVFWTIGLKPA